MHVLCTFFIVQIMFRTKKLLILRNTFDGNGKSRALLHLETTSQTCWLHIKKKKKWCSDYRHISVTERRFLISESPKALLWMSALPRLALLFCIKAWNVTLSPNAPWGARDYCVHESKIEAYCWEISEALSLAIPKGQRQAWREGDYAVLSAGEKKYGQALMMGSVEPALSWPALTAWWEGECRRLRESHFINSQQAPKNTF